MKKVLFPLAFISLFAISCKKDDPAPNPSSETYMNITAGSVRNYRFTDNNDATNNEDYSLTSTTRDTTAVGKTYHVFTNNSDGSSEYYNKTASDYFQLQDASAIGAGVLENLYLKEGAAVGTSWTQTYNIDLMGTPVSLVITNRVETTGTSKVVLGNTYNNVIQIKTTISASAGFPIPVTSDLRSYYAPKFGLIESTNMLNIALAGIDVNTKTELISSTFP